MNPDEDRLRSLEGIMERFDLSRPFIGQWTSDAAAEAFAAGTSKIPQMPHLHAPTLRFHVPSVREWLLTHFQKGGGK